VSNADTDRNPNAAGDCNPNANGDCHGDCLIYAHGYA
jgi:hypothetical protein